MSDPTAPVPRVLAGRRRLSRARPKPRCRRSPIATSSAIRRLQALIEQALANNRDLLVAAANIAAARAQVRIQRADQFPQVGRRGGRTPSPASGRHGISALSGRAAACRASSSTCSAGCGR